MAVQSALSEKKKESTDWGIFPAEILADLKSPADCESRRALGSTALVDDDDDGSVRLGRGRCIFSFVRLLACVRCARKGSHAIIKYEPRTLADRCQRNV